MTLAVLDFVAIGVRNCGCFSGSHGVIGECNSDFGAAHDVAFCF